MLDGLYPSQLVDVSTMWLGRWRCIRKQLLSTIYPDLISTHSFVALESRHKLIQLASNIHRFDKGFVRYYGSYLVSIPWSDPGMVLEYITWTEQQSGSDGEE
jgi:hypothetical protein